MYKRQIELFILFHPLLNIIYSDKVTVAELDSELSHNKIVKSYFKT